MIVSCFLKNFLSRYCRFLDGDRFIEEEDLLRFLKKEEVDLVLPMFEGAVETGKIKRKSLKNWLVSAS